VARFIENIVGERRAGKQVTNAGKEREMAIKDRDRDLRQSKEEGGLYLWLYLFCADC
jgi:hypothetical protein